MKIIELFNRLPITGRYGMCEVLVEYMNDKNIVDHNLVCLDDLLLYIDKIYLNYLKESKFSEYVVVKDLTEGVLYYTSSKSTSKSKISTISNHILDPDFKKIPNQNAQLNYYTKSKKIIDPNGLYVFELVFKNTKYKYCFSQKNGKSNSKYVIFPELSSLEEHIQFYCNIKKYINSIEGQFMRWTKGSSGLVKKHYNDGNWLNTNETHSVISKFYKLDMLINNSESHNSTWIILHENGKCVEYIITKKWLDLANEIDLLKSINGLINHDKNNDNDYIYDLNEQSDSMFNILASDDTLTKIVDHVVKYKIPSKEKNKLVDYILKMEKMETQKGKEIGEKMCSFSYIVAKKRVLKEKNNPSLEEKKIISKKYDSYKNELVNILNKSTTYSDLIKNVESFTVKHSDKYTNSFLMTKFFEIPNWNILTEEQYNDLILGIRCGLYLHKTDSKALDLDETETETETISETESININI